MGRDLPQVVAGQAWKGKYRGQTQKWFAMRFTGRDSDIDIAQQHPEFSEWRWAAPDSLARKIVPFKARLYDAIVREFSGVLRS